MVAIMMSVIRAAIDGDTFIFPIFNDVRKFIIGFPTRARTADISMQVRILLKYQARKRIAAVMAQMMMYFESLFIYTCI